MTSLSGYVVLRCLPVFVHWWAPLLIPRRVWPSYFRSDKCGAEEYRRGRRNQSSTGMTGVLLCSLFLSANDFDLRAIPFDVLLIQDCGRLGGYITGFEMLVTLSRLDRRMAEQ